MLITISELRSRVENEIEVLVADLQALTQRYTFEEAQAWRNSLPRIVAAFGEPSFQTNPVLSRPCGWRSISGIALRQLARYLKGD